MGEPTCDHGADEDPSRLEVVAKEMKLDLNKGEERFLYRAQYYFERDKEFRNGEMECEEAHDYATLNDLIADFDASRHAYGIERKHAHKAALKNRAEYFEAHALRVYIHLLEYPVMSGEQRFKHVEGFIGRGQLRWLQVPRIPVYHQALLKCFYLDDARHKFELMVSDVANYMIQGDYKSAIFERGILCDWVEHTREKHDIQVISTTDFCQVLLDLKSYSINKLLENADHNKVDTAKRDECIKQALAIPKFDIFNGLVERDPAVIENQDYSWVQEKALDIANKK
jgi:hypothetical protein